jgi:glycosyltransferase involved in cell wall biosynthesis
MKVSIATICLNQGQFVSQAIESVLSQDHPDVEYIVVDAGSTDESRTVIERYRERIAHVVFEPDSGPADGLNKALRLATGDIWACVNADDVLLPRASSSACASFKGDPSLDVVYGDGYVVDACLRTLRRERSDDFNPRRYAYGVGVVVHQATFIKRRAVLAAGGYNVSNRTCWDGELLLELALTGARMSHVDDPWGMFRIHTGSITGSQRLRNHYEADGLRLFERATGRQWRKYDAALVMLARGLKAVSHPRAAVSPSTRLAKYRARRVEGAHV